jgi:hypothetical protein
LKLAHARLELGRGATIVSRIPPPPPFRMCGSEST